jgi:hypothetical protein
MDQLAQQVSYKLEQQLDKLHIGMDHHGLLIVIFSIIVVM